jgi:hypothetical protein
MAARGRLWGAERIRGELLKVGIKVSKRTIQVYMRGVRNRGGGQSWATFLNNHAERIWVCDSSKPTISCSARSTRSSSCTWRRAARPRRRDPAPDAGVDGTADAQRHHGWGRSSPLCFAIATASSVPRSTARRKVSARR